MATQPEGREEKYAPAPPRKLFSATQACRKLTKYLLCQKESMLIGSLELFYAEGSQSLPISWFNPGSLTQIRRREHAMIYLVKGNLIIWVIPNILLRKDVWVFPNLLMA